MGGALRSRRPLRPCRAAAPFASNPRPANFPGLIDRMSARIRRRTSTGSTASSRASHLPPRRRINASPPTVKELNDLPIKVVGDAVIYLRDVATVSDGYAPQTNVAPGRQARRPSERAQGRYGQAAAVLRCDCIGLKPWNRITASLAAEPPAQIGHAFAPFLAQQHDPGYEGAKLAPGLGT